MAQTKDGAIKRAANQIGITVEEYRAKITAGEKRCFKCKTWKPVTYFGCDSTRHDGLSAKCIACSRVIERKCWKGRASTFKGCTHTTEAKQMMSAARKGKASPKIGIPRTTEERKRISESLRASTKVRRGADHYAFSHGKAQRAYDDRRKPEYVEWRNAVFARDAFTCQDCGDATGGNLRAHHIKSFAGNPDLRFSVDNGLTLCHTCHEKRHVKPDSIRNVRKLKRGERLYK